MNITNPSLRWTSITNDLLAPSVTVSHGKQSAVDFKGRRFSGLYVDARSSIPTNTNLVTVRLGVSVERWRWGAVD